MGRWDRRGRLRSQARVRAEHRCGSPYLDPCEAQQAAPPRAQQAAPLLREGAARLKAAGIEDARLEAEVLLRHVAGLDRAGLFARLDQPMSPAVIEGFRALIERRAQREPLAYLTNQREFYGRELYVDRRVLIPRPETELLVDEVLRKLRALGRPEPVVADVGTGSGAIAVTVAAEWPSARVWAVDVSADALAVAAANCGRWGVADRVRLFQGHLLEPVPELVDVIAANLPYIAEAELPQLQPEVRAWEPRLALVTAESGTRLIRELIESAPRRLRPDGLIGLEIGVGQATTVCGIAAAVFPTAQVTVRRDLAGLERVVTIELPK